jgi:hypothetical protein
MPDLSGQPMRSAMELPGDDYPGGDPGPQNQVDQVCRSLAYSIQTFAERSRTDVILDLARQA